MWDPHSLPNNRLNVVVLCVIGLQLPQQREHCSTHAAKGSERALLSSIDSRKALFY